MARMTDPQHDLFTFAFCGNRETVFEDVHLKHLSEIADEEKWTSNNNDGHDFDILFYYIIKTFEIISKQNSIRYDSNSLFAVFNTGLMTPNGEDIYGYFEPNNRPGAQSWYFKGFAPESDRVFSRFVFDKPPVAKYDNNVEEFHFDSSASIEFNGDHIFDDHWDNDDRFPAEIKNLGKPLAVASIKSAFDVTKKKILRNPRLAVPQYYIGKIMFLLPIKVETISGPVTMALAVEKTLNGSYRANTIFDLESAYKKARLITKPESNWLIE